MRPQPALNIGLLPMSKALKEIVYVETVNGQMEPQKKKKRRAKDQKSLLERLAPYILGLAFLLMLCIELVQRALR